MKVQLENNFISDNSKECEKGCYFLLDNNNKAYLNEAKAKEAIIIDEKKARELLNIDENIKIIAITGTNGKTTSAALIYSMLLDLGYKVFLSGTRGAFCNDVQVAQKKLTTPFLLEFLYFLQIASKNHCEYFVMEASSHSIAQQRFADAKFCAKIYTNLTQDHLDYHKSFEEYARVKASFFQDDCLKIINNDAFKFTYNVKNSITYGIDNPALYSVKAYSIKDKITAIISKKDELFEISSNLCGLFNLYNILCAFACVNELTKEGKKAAQYINNFLGVKGRMQEIIHNDENRGKIIIDFAHTPDGISNVLSALATKNIICVLGAGGNRDKSKRSPMAKIASHFSKNVILTSDNPRDEEPLFIISDMLSDLDENELKNISVCIDRKEAIYKALRMQNDEIVMILGKGDESTQEIKGIKYDFSDENEVYNALEKIKLEEEKRKEKGYV